MLEYKLIKLVKVLSQLELQEVEKYLLTPYFNTNADLTKLFLAIGKFRERMDSPQFTKEALFSVLYGKQTYNHGKFRKLMTQLTQLIEQYLIQKELKKSEEMQVKLLARSLGERDNYKLFLEMVETRLKTLNKRPERGRDYFRECYELCEMVFYHPGSDELGNRSEYLIRAIGEFEKYFTLVMLQNEADNIVRSRLVRGQDFSQYLDTTRQLAETPEFASSNAIRLFNQIVNLLHGQEAEQLDQLRNTTFETFGQLSRFEQDFALNLLRNYAIPISNKGSLSHTRFILDLYRMELDRGFFANTISSGNFMNIVSMGLAVGEFDWVEQFMDQFHHYLPKDEVETTLNYCKGIWHYQKGLKSNSTADFYAGIQVINMIPIRIGAKYELRVRPTLLRIHFEVFARGEETLDDLLNQVRNFERHLTGSSDYPDTVKGGYLNFLRYFKVLARFYSNPDSKKKNIDGFLEKLSAAEDEVALKGWIQKKAQELANSY